MEVSPAIFERGQNRRVLKDVTGLRRSENSREAMEDCVVHVKDVYRVGELGGVPVVVGWEDGRFSKPIDSEDVGFHRLIR